MCGDSDACSICNADGSVLGAPATNNMTEIMMNAQSILAAWPVDARNVMEGYGMLWNVMDYYGMFGLMGYEK